MRVSVSSNGMKLASEVDKMQVEMSRNTKKALSRTAQFGMAVIKDRTEKGQSYKGGAFKKYSSSYLDFRRDIGASQTPNLEVTGEMLGAMTTNANRKEATIFFSMASEAKKAKKNERTRPFFGFSKSEVNKLADVFFRNL
tara:strand:+ start:2360 stop:2779 length:420 start_codon:yes stop_codon:yes gene_type:complete